MYFVLNYSNLCTHQNPAYRIAFQRFATAELSRAHFSTAKLVILFLKTKHLQKYFSRVGKDAEKRCSLCGRAGCALADRSGLHTQTLSDSKTFYLQKTSTVMENTIVEPQNEQGKFESALRLLNEKLKHFHCPICHAEDGVTFFDDPFFVMHYPWIKGNKDKETWSIDSSSGYGKSCILGVCNNCGYSMLFNVEVLSPSYKRLIIREQREVIATVVKETIRKKAAK
jgi:hypothetical protein